MPSGVIFENFDAVTYKKYVPN